VETYFGVNGSNLAGNTTGAFERVVECVLLVSKLRPSQRAIEIGRIKGIV
jgi:hypothetical protein